MTGYGLPVFDGGDMDEVLDGGAFTGVSNNLFTPTEYFKDFSFSVRLVSTPRAVNPTISTVPVADRIYIKNQSAIILDDRFMEVTMRDFNKPEEITISSSNPSVATVRQWGRVSNVNDGNSIIKVSSPSYSKSLSAIFKRTSGDVNTFVRYADDSLALHCTNTVINAINGRSPAGINNVYYQYQTGQMIRNPNCWANDLGVDISFLPDYNTQRQSPEWCGALITPRHILSVGHVTSLSPGAGGIVSGDRFSFTSMGNVQEWRTVTRTTGLNLEYLVFPECSILELDSDLPSYIKPAKIMPSGSEHYLPTIPLSNGPLVYSYYGFSFAGVPSITGFAPFYVVCANKYRVLGIKYGVSSFHHTYLEFADSSYFYPGERLSDFFIPTVGNDSSNVNFLVINGEACITNSLSVLTPIGCAGDNLCNLIPRINGLISGLGSSHRVSSPDLSFFPFYPNDYH